MNFLKDWGKNFCTIILFIIGMAIFVSPTFLIVIAIAYESVILSVIAFLALIASISLVLTLDIYENEED